jgi:hypothetical protein
MNKVKLFRRKGLTPAIQVTGTEENIKAITGFALPLAVHNYPETKKISIQTDPAIYANYGDYIASAGENDFYCISEEKFKELYIVEV